MSRTSKAQMNLSTDRAAKAEGNVSTGGEKYNLDKCTGSGSGGQSKDEIFKLISEKITNRAEAIININAPVPILV